MVHSVKTEHQDDQRAHDTQCLGRRLQRELWRNGELFGDVPRDIGYPELALLHGDKAQTIKFRTEHAGQVSVELFPDVVGRFRIGRAAVSPAADEISDRNSSQLREIAELLGIAQAKMKNLLKGPQMDLFKGRGEPARSKGYKGYK